VAKKGDGWLSKGDLWLSLKKLPLLLERRCKKSASGPWGRGEECVGGGSKSIDV
jgi:hypothetical protein